MEDHFLKGLKLSLFDLKGRFKEGKQDSSIFEGLNGFGFGYLLWR